jgi:amino acid adenylation domain-containing protein
MNKEIYKTALFNQERFNSQREYWNNIIAGELKPNDLIVDIKRNHDQERDNDSIKIILPEELSLKLLNSSKHSDIGLYILMLAAFKAFLFRYARNDEVLMVSPLLNMAHRDKRSKKYNKRILFRDIVDTSLTFKELLLETKNKTLAAYRNQDYPLELVFEKAGSKPEDFLFIDRFVFLLKNIHDEKDVIDLKYDLLFSFLREGKHIIGEVRFDKYVFKSNTVEDFINKYIKILEISINETGRRIREYNFLAGEELKQLLHDFNKTASVYSKDKTIHQLFEEQVKKTPDHTAVIFDRKELSYKDLNIKANQLAWFLKRKGIGPGVIVGILMDNSFEMIISILGILKAGGSYLPIGTDLPHQRMIALLNESNASLLLTKEEIIKDVDFISLKNFENSHLKPYITPSRLQVMDLDSLQKPDRSLVDYDKYHPFIGQSMVKNSITVQFSRGCVYKCLYCFRIWPDKYACRSGENLFEEVNFYYKMGIRRFGFTDDLPNFNKKEIEKFYRLIIKNGLKAHLHFPNGIRGDILTQAHIDLMVEAGTVTMDLALETASPRLQRLVKKNVNIERLRENVQYIIDHYPHVILGVQIMHGFPTETQEEARASLDFIKSFKWLPFGYMHILKIYPNTAMARFAMEHGVSEKAILKSMHLGYHELPETLPFSKDFTKQCQSEYLAEFFLLKERLIKVLPYQMSMLTEDELVQKYNSYLPEKITSFPDLLGYLAIDRKILKAEFLAEGFGKVDHFNEKLRKHFLIHKSHQKATRLLLLDLSQCFSCENENIYQVTDPPLGLMYLLTYLNKKLGRKIRGKIAKSGIDFDSFDQLKSLVHRFQPDVIGIRTLTFFKDFFHKTISLIRQWGIDVPIIVGGPYATSSWQTVIQDSNIDLAVLGEGEITLHQLMEKIIGNRGKLPPEEDLKNINGIAFIRDKEKSARQRINREVVMMDRISEVLARENGENFEKNSRSTDLAYIIYTSGSSGIPKGVMIRHYNLVNQVEGLKKRFELDAGLHYLILAAFTFDVSVMHVFLALTTGEKFFLIPEKIRKDPLKLWQFIYESKINILNIVPAYMKALLENLEKKKFCFKYLFVGGDTFSSELYRSLTETFIFEKLINIYGPTETTINATLYECDHKAGAGVLPIGQPLLNYNAYILDRDMNLVPIGAQGELCIGGEGVARGYLNNVLLTDEKFVNNPFKKSEKLYKTGDMARWLPDGNIEFLGRLDHQVKVRGFRIELAEIEHRLQKKDEVKDAVVIERKDKNGDKYLCAYVVPVPAAVSLNTQAIKEYLAVYLPEYMIPSFFMQMKQLPLTSNGKIDRKALPELEPSTCAPYIPPTTEAEKKLLSLWSEILNIPKKMIGVNSNFFELGGHSLKAIILISKIHKEMNIKIPLVELFRRITIRRLAEYMEQSGPSLFTSITSVEKKEYYPLSSAQKRLFILQQMNLDNTNYNMPSVVTLEKDIQRERLEIAFKKLINRQESLRSSFEMLEEEPVQKICEDMDFTIDYIEMASAGHGPAGSEAEGRKELQEIIENFEKPFDLSKAPLLRVGLVKLHSPGKLLLLLDMHHIITDGASQQILVKEFLDMYAGKDLPPMRLRYKDFAGWQNSRKQQQLMKQQELFWLQLFSQQPPVLTLPTDYPRPVLQSFEGASLNFALKKKETHLLKDLAKKNDVTLYMLMLAIFNILLSKLSGQEDIIVGTLAAGRRHADLEHIVGMFVNTLAMRNYPQGHKTVSTFLKEVKKGTLAAYENQEYQFEDLVDKISLRRDTSRNPVFDVMFDLLNDPGYREDMPDTSENSGDEPRKGTSKFDLILTAVDFGETIDFRLEYCSRLFAASTIKRFIGYFKKMVISLSETGDVKLAHLELMTGEEKENILNNISRGDAVTLAAGKTISQLFEERAKFIPGETALIFRDEILKYGKLNEKSNQLARILRQKGVGPDTVVALMVRRSFEMIIAILAIMKAGGAYLPIDSEYPAERINYMIEDSGTKLILTNHDEESILSYIPGDIDMMDTRNRDIYCVDSSNPNHANQGTDLAYIIYTSGSTGKPKGVMIEQRSVLNTLLAMQRKYPVKQTDVYLLKTSFVFDVSVAELFGWFLGGGKLSILEIDEEKDAGKISDAIERDSITHINFIPSMFNVFIDSLEEAGIKKLSSLEYIFLAGEALLPEHVIKYRKFHLKGKLENIYGPTEGTIYSSWYSLSQWVDRGSIPIGRPMPNTRLYILDKDGLLQPPGVSGELCIGGVGVASGYLNSPELTAEKFDLDICDLSDYHDEEDPFGQINKKFLRGSRGQFLQKAPPGRRRQKIFKTGDLVRWLPDGNIEFLGRIDQQVKIRGYRIELAEIASHLVMHEQIKEAVVLAKEEESGEKYLCAYITSPVKPLAVDLREYLAQKLPGYMIPAYFEQLEKMPLTSNGKLDLQTLAAYEIEVKPAAEYLEPESEMEIIIRDIWKEILKPDKIGINDNFFEIGGNSLKILQVINKLKKLLKKNIPMVSMFEYPTIKTFSHYLSQDRLDGRRAEEEILQWDAQHDEAISRMEETLQLTPGNSHD